MGAPCPKWAVIGLQDEMSPAGGSVVTFGQDASRYFTIARRGSIRADFIWRPILNDGVALRLNMHAHWPPLPAVCWALRVARRRAVPCWAGEARRSVAPFECTTNGSKGVEFARPQQERPR